MRILAIVAVVLLTGCENPRVGIGATISGSGVSVTPSVAGEIGDVTVAVSR